MNDKPNFEQLSEPLRGRMTGYQRLKRLVASAILVSLACSMPAKSDDYAKVAFDAIYAASSPIGTQTLRIKSDGKGHMKSEMGVSGQKVVTICDYPNKTAYSFVEGQKKAWLIALKPLATVHDQESATKANAKSLGAKVINGHPCRGWEYKSGDSETTVWIGDDIDYLVKSEEALPNGKNLATTELTSITKAMPSASEFKLPQDCKLTPLPSR